MIKYVEKEYDINVFKSLDGIIIDGNKNNKFDKISNLNNILLNSIVYVDSYKNFKIALNSDASFIILKSETFKNGLDNKIIDTNKTYIIFPYPKIIFAYTTGLFKKRVVVEKNISNFSVIKSNFENIENIHIGNFSTIDKNVTINKNTYIGNNVNISQNVSIGSNCYIYDNVTILSNVSIGDNCIIHAGTIIGSDGFGYEFNGKEHQKIEQLGEVIIGLNVEIGANCTIDCATIDKTIISNGVKIDNLCQIAHNVFIGENTVIASQTGIAGGAKIGKFCILAGQVGIADHAELGDQVIVAAKTGVTTKKYGSNRILASGIPPFDRADYRRLMVYLKRLPELYKKVGL